MDIYIVRHGNTFDSGDVIRRVGAGTDLPLSSSGMAQAEALAAHFSDAIGGFERAYSSPLLRTRQTAEAILARQPGAAILQFEPFLREIDYGPDEGKPEDEVVTRLGEAALAAWESDATVPDGWQVAPEALISAWRCFFEKVGAEVEDGPVLAVTSNGIARFALQAVGDAGEGFPLKLKTGAYGIIRLSADAPPTVIAWNERPPARA